MKNLTLLKQILPELYLFIAVFIYWSLTALWFNPVAIALLVILIFQIIRQNMTSGMVIGVVFLLLNAYLLLALFSDVQKVEVFDAKAQKFVFSGLAFLLPNVVAAVFMILKYGKNKQ